MIEATLNIEVKAIKVDFLWSDVTIKYKMNNRIHMFDFMSRGFNYKTDFARFERALRKK